MADELKKDILAAIVDEEQDEDDLDVPIQPTNDSSNQDQIVIDDAHRYLLDKKALIAHYRKTNNQQNDNTFILLSEGNLLLTKKKIYDAANKYISAIDLFDKDALLSLGELFLYIKNYSQAQILLETAYELGIRNETLFENICHVYELLDKYHEIIDFIIKNELSFKKKEMFLGNAYFAINELKDAEKNYLLAVERKQYEIIPNLFACYEKLEQFDDADKFLDYLVSINYTPPPFIVGSYYFIKKDYINAKKHLLSVEKKDSNVLHFLAVSCDNLEQYDEANQYFQELLQSNYQADYA
jgi:tetratricopeptide (TPR) repeat protein